MIGTLHRKRYEVDQFDDERFLIVLGLRTPTAVEAMIVTPANRTAPVGRRVLMGRDELHRDWDEVDVEDAR